MIETNRIEFKRQLTRDMDIEKEVVAFLNYREGGIIYVGIDDSGKPVENELSYCSLLKATENVLDKLKVENNVSSEITYITPNFIRVTIPFYTQKDTRKDTRSKVQILLDYCTVPQSLEEMMSILNLKNRPSFTRTYIRPLLAQGLLEMTLPDKPNSKNQRYVAKKA